MYVFMNIHDILIHLFMFEFMQKYVYLYTCFDVHVNMYLMNLCWTWR